MVGRVGGKEMWSKETDVPNMSFRGQVHILVVSAQGEKAGVVVSYSAG